MPNFQSNVVRIAARLMIGYPRETLGLSRGLTAWPMSVLLKTVLVIFSCLRRCSMPFSREHDGRVAMGRCVVGLMVAGLLSLVISSASAASPDDSWPNFRGP